MDYGELSEVDAFQGFIMIFKISHHGFANAVFMSPKDHISAICTHTVLSRWSVYVLLLLWFRHTSSEQAVYFVRWQCSTRELREVLLNLLCLGHLETIPVLAECPAMSVTST